jgi:hypothetical protein
MDAFELSIMIERPIEEAFAVLANLENDVKWHSAFVEVRNTSGGSQWRRRPVSGVRRASRPADSCDRIRGYRVRAEPDRGLENRVGTSPAKFWRTFERVDGGTRFAVRYEGAPRGFLKLAWPLITRIAKRQQGGDMRKLKELMEARAL